MSDGKSRRSSGVEYFLGKEGVVGSIPIVGSKSVTCIINATYLNVLTLI
jgi:hypothetical protein